MTLHEAITQVLIQQDKPLSPIEIAAILNATSWYTKKDGSKIKSSQIGARVENYPNLFNNKDGLISLKSSPNIISKKRILKQKQISVDSIKSNSKLLMKVLINEKNFKALPQCEQDIPDVPGLYCIRIKQPKTLDTVFSNVLTERNHTIIYIGMASKSLKKQFLGQELRAKGHGSFFRNLGAVLGYCPEAGSLIGKRNQNNYKFSSEDEQDLIKWIDENLIINWVAASDNLDAIEDKLIQKHLPLMNISGNPGAFNNVRVLRDKCKAMARGTI